MSVVSTGFPTNMPPMNKRSQGSSSTGNIQQLAPPTGSNSYPPMDQPTHRHSHSMDDLSDIAGQSNANQPPMVQHSKSQTQMKTEPVVPPKLTTSSSAPSSSVITSVKKSLFGWLHPDAHDTSENMGEENTAVYDKATGKWIFPDDPNNPTAPDPSDAPPPTGPLGGSMGGGMGGPQSTPNTTEGSGEYDPLAALMAPPSRSVYQAAPVDTNDPLAMMMAPPPVRLPSGGGGGSGPPSGGGPASYNVWKPPTPSPSQETPSTHSPSSSGPPGADFTQPPMNSFQSGPPSGSGQGYGNTSSHSHSTASDGPPMSMPLGSSSYSSDGGQGPPSSSNSMMAPSMGNGSGYGGPPSGGSGGGGGPPTTGGPPTSGGLAPPPMF